MTYRISITPKENLQRDKYSIATSDKELYAHYPKEAPGKQIKKLLEETLNVTLEQAKEYQVITETIGLMSQKDLLKGKYRSKENMFETQNKVKKNIDEAKNLTDFLKPCSIMLEGLDNEDIYTIAISEIE